MKWLHMVAFVLLVVGGLNWGLVGIFDFNLVASLFVAGSMTEMIVYGLVGISAIYIAATHMNDCKVCSKK